MNFLAPLVLADAGASLSWTEWFAVLGGLAGFASLAITLLRGRAPTPAVELARSPAPATAPIAPVVSTPVATPAPQIDESITSEVLALITAAVQMTLGPRASIAAVTPADAPSVELLQQWSVEGRRQIYSSHQIR